MLFRSYSYKTSEAFNRIGFASGVNTKDNQHRVVCGLSGSRKAKPVHVIKLGGNILVKKVAFCSSCDLKLTDIF